MDKSTKKTLEQTTGMMLDRANTRREKFFLISERDMIELGEIGNEICRRAELGHEPTPEEIAEQMLDLQELATAEELYKLGERLNEIQARVSETPEGSD